jgi:DNA-binding NarL/FixJ family response regulator
MIRVLLCDDQALVREGLRAILGTAPQLEVVGVAADGASAVELARKLQPDLVLMDLNMPGMTGIQATRLIREELPHVKVLALTTYDADEWVFDAIRAGAAGYLLKDASREELITAIEGTVAGRTYVDPTVAGKVLAQVAQTPGAPGARNPALAASLNTRERDILRLITRGMTNAEIAHTLFLSEGTVRNHLSAIFEKLGVTDRTQAAVIALRHGLVD